MNRKQLCVANVRYRKPSTSEAKRSRDLLKYLTYRDGRHAGVRQVSGKERWLDRGMGGSVAEIAQRCDNYRSDHVLLFTLVFNVNPELTRMVPADDRERFVRELTETTVEDFFEARGIDTGVEWSAVLHHRLSENPQSPGLHNPHTHVILPGTYWSEEAGHRVPLYFSRNHKVDHIALLHDITERSTADLLTRYTGPDWEARIDALEAVREVEQRVVETEAHMQHVDETGRTWSVWAGTRRTDEATTALGYYRYFPVGERDDPDEPDRLRLEFRPLLNGLSHQEAGIFREWLDEQVRGDLDDYARQVEQLGELPPTERRRLAQRLHRQRGVEHPDRHQRDPEL